LFELPMNVLPKIHSLETGPLDEAGLSQLAAVMATSLVAPLMVYLRGDLGAGKTTFTRAMLRKLGYKGIVKSPTYGLLERYTLSHFEVVHVDLYRIAEAGELEFLGLQDLHSSKSVFMIEWPERGDPHLAAPDLTIRFSHAGTERELLFAFHTSITENLQIVLANSIQ